MQLNLCERVVGCPRRARVALSSLTCRCLEASRAGGRRRIGLEKGDPLIDVERSSTSQGSNTEEEEGEAG